MGSSISSILESFRINTPSTHTTKENPNACKFCYNETCLYKSMSNAKIPGSGNNSFKRNLSIITEFSENEMTEDFVSISSTKETDSNNIIESKSFINIETEPDIVLINESQKEPEHTIISNNIQNILEDTIGYEDEENSIYIKEPVSIVEYEDEENSIYIEPTSIIVYEDEENSIYIENPVSTFEYENEEKIDDFDETNYDLLFDY